MEWRLAQVTPYVPSKNGPNPLPTPESLKLEWAADWESGTQTVFSDSVIIPRGVATPGRVYRARVRHRDTTGRWSHWSNPIEFTASLASDKTPAQTLVITEFISNPHWPNTEEKGFGFSSEDFEFIELMNIGDTEISLGDFRISNGVVFDFGMGEIEHLAPGERVIVVRNAYAMTRRYGPGLPIAGEWYDSRLADKSERITLSKSDGTIVLDFTYDTDLPFSDDTTHRGFSRVLVDPHSNPDPAILNSWRLSKVIGGTPGH